MRQDHGHRCVKPCFRPHLAYCDRYDIDRRGSRELRRSGLLDRSFCLVLSTSCLLPPRSSIDTDWERGASPSLVSICAYALGLALIVCGWGYGRGLVWMNNAYRRMICIQCLLGDEHVRKLLAYGVPQEVSITGKVSSGVFCTCQGS